MAMKGGEITGAAHTRTACGPPGASAVQPDRNCYRALITDMPVRMAGRIAPG